MQGGHLGAQGGVSNAPAREGAGGTHHVWDDDADVGLDDGVQS